MIYYSATFFIHVKYMGSMYIYSCSYIPNSVRNSSKESFPSPSGSAAFIISSNSWWEIFTGKLARTNLNSSRLTKPSQSGSNLIALLSIVKVSKVVKKCAQTFWTFLAVHFRDSLDSWSSGARNWGILGSLVHPTRQRRPRWSYRWPHCQWGFVPLSSIRPSVPAKDTKGFSLRLSRTHVWHQSHKVLAHIMLDTNLESFPNLFRQL